MKSRYFLGLALVALIISGGLITLNRNHAGSLASKITAKDDTGAYIEQDLQVLSAYTKAHMFASTSIFLKGSYDRAVHTANTSSASVDPSIYSSAQSSCAGRADSIAQSKCVADYIASHSTPQANPQAQPQPNKADYTRTYMSPGWTPDAAGIFMLIGAVFGIAGVYLLIYRKL